MDLAYLQAALDAGQPAVIAVAAAVAAAAAVMVAAAVVSFVEDHR